MVADMAAYMELEVDKVTEMVANMVEDMELNMATDMFKTKPKLFDAKCTRLACLLSGYRFSGGLFCGLDNFLYIQYLCMDDKPFLPKLNLMFGKDQFARRCEPHEILLEKSKKRPYPIKWKGLSKISWS